MRKIVRSSLLVLCVVLAGETVYSQPVAPDITVGDIDLSRLRWGNQAINFDVANNTDELKFVTLEVTLESPGAYLSGGRTSRSHHILLPEETRSISHPVFIPGIWGQLKIVVSLYDVVDTLDVLLPGQKFLEQPFFIDFSVPETLYTYLNERIDLPPRVNDHPIFDSDFSRLLLLLLNEGRTAGEIADLARTDTNFVLESIRLLVNMGYVKPSGDRYRLAFPFIDVPEAQEVRELADDLSISLAEVIARNMSGYNRVLDSLVAAEVVAADSNTFMDPGVVLYRRYPVVSALLLWFYLGRMFITDTLPLAIYAGTDPCNAHIPDFMYAVRGGAVFNGSHFFLLNLRTSAYQILFADEIPELECGGNFARLARFNRSVSWGYKKAYVPETFMLDTAVVMPMLEALALKTETLLAGSRSRLAAIARRHGHETVTRGYRYWFWNLVATRTLRKLVDEGVVTRRGNGFYKMDSLPARSR